MCNNVCFFTYHPPVVDIRRQLDVVSGPNRRNVRVVVFVEPVRDSRVPDATGAGARLLQRGVGGRGFPGAHVAGDQLHPPGLVPAGRLQVVQAHAAPQRGGEEERGEEDQDQGNQDHPDSAGAPHPAPSVAPSWRAGSTSASTVQAGPLLGESGSSPGQTPTPGPPAPVLVRCGGRDAAPPWPCPHPEACHCPKPTTTTTTTFSSLQQPPRVCSVRRARRDPRGDNVIHSFTLGGQTCVHTHTHSHTQPLNEPPLQLDCLQSLFSVRDDLFLSSSHMLSCFHLPVTDLHPPTKVFLCYSSFLLYFIIQIVVLKVDRTEVAPLRPLLLEPSCARNAERTLK